jgi:hypothetical protein
VKTIAGTMDASTLRSFFFMPASVDRSGRLASNAI